MEIIRAALRNQLDLTAGASPVSGYAVCRSHPEFLNRFDGRVSHSRKGKAARLVVHVDSINRKVALIGPGPSDSSIPIRTASGVWRNTSLQTQQSRGILAKDGWQILQRPGIQHVSDAGIFSIQRFRSGSLDFDELRDLSDLECGITGGRQSNTE